jgi:hypothetical protein
MKTREQRIKTARLIWIACLLLQFYLLTTTKKIWDVGTELDNMGLKIGAVCVTAAICAVIIFSIYRLVTFRKWVKTITGKG